MPPLPSGEGWGEALPVSSTVISRPVRPLLRKYFIAPVVVIAAEAAPTGMLYLILSSVMIAAGKVAPTERVLAFFLCLHGVNGSATNG